MGQVNTVRGPVDAAQLGTTLMHEHVFVRSPEVALNWPTGWDRDTQVARAVDRLHELKAAGITISSGALAKYLSRRSSNSAMKRTTTAAKPNHVPEPHGQVKTGTKEPEHRESGTGPK